MPPAPDAQDIELTLDHQTDALALYRPCSVSTLVGRGWLFCKKTLKPAFGLVLTLVIIQMVMTLPMLGFQMLARESKSSGNIALMIALLVVMLVTSFAGYGAMYVVSCSLIRYYLGRAFGHAHITIKSSFQFVVRHALPLIGLFIWSFAVSIFWAIGFYLVLFLILFPLFMIFGFIAAMNAKVLGVAVLVIAILVGVVLYILALGGFSYLLNVLFFPMASYLVSDGKTLFNRLGYGYKLLFSSGLRGFGFSFLLMVCSVAILTSWILPAQLWMLWEMTKTGISATAGEPISLMTGIVTLWSNLLWPIVACMMLSSSVLFFMDAQVRKSGKDIEHKLHQLAKRHQIVLA